MAISQEQYNKEYKAKFISNLKTFLNYFNMGLYDFLYNLIISSHQTQLKLKKPLPSIVEVDAYLKAVDGNMPDYELSSRVIKLLNKVKKEVENIKLEDTTFEDIVENVPEEEMVATLILHNTSFTILSSVKKDKVMSLKTQIHLALKKIENSPFKKALLNSSVSIGTIPALKNEGFRISDPEAVASYYRLLDHITYIIDSKGESKSGDRPPYQSLIHEFGHRYHYTQMINGYKNQSIIDLYTKAMVSQEQCYIDQLPKIGDPLSNLREDWWNVKMGSENYVLSKIENDIYTYISDQGNVLEFNRASILKRITCPSKYGAKNVEEFFAEMVTLIILGLVKPSQKILADKFMQIVEQESK
jgi:hypothetical protein